MCPARTRVGNEAAVGLRRDHCRLIVVFVFDVADDLLDDIFHGDDAVGAAILVHDQSQMNARRLHLHEQVDGGHRFRHEQDRPDQLRLGKRLGEIDGFQVEIGRQYLAALRLRFRIDLRPVGEVSDQVADMDHAGRIVERVVENDETRMRRGLEGAQQVT